MIDVLVLGALTLIYASMLLGHFVNPPWSRDRTTSSRSIGS
ncbi:hypothetical protein [Streptomyces sp. NPDC051561]